MNEHEDWLYEDGASANYTTFIKKEKEVSAKLNVYKARQEFDALYKTLKENSAATFEKIEK